MTLKQYLLLLINEESNELAKETDKAIRFGVAERNPGDNKTNEERLSNKFIDLITIMYIANCLGINIYMFNIKILLEDVQYAELISTKIIKTFKSMKQSVFDGQLAVPIAEIRKLEDTVQNKIYSLINE